MDGRKWFLSLLWTSCFLMGKSQGNIPRTDCPDYVEENANLSCSCLAPDNFQGTASLSWPGHSNTGLLTVTSVRREDNGTRYTCQMVAGGTTTSTDYTLKVAYGPYKDKVQVSPLQFVTNWTQSFTMTCFATDVYPLPSYVWDVIQCDNGNAGSTCTFTPHSPTHITRATCIASHKDFGDTVVIKRVQLNFKYPPSESPQITRHAAGGELLRTGDTVTCTVTGGRPAVDEVIFYCTDPQLDGHPGDVNATSVSSTVTVDSARATEDNMTCFCSAVWKPTEDYYHLASEVAYIIEHKALVKSLTLNGVKRAVNVAVEDHVTILLACQTFGRPRPTDVKVTKVDNDNFADAHMAQVINTGRWRSESTVTLSDVQCSDMGTYVCTASNGVGPADSRTVLLNVRCPPRKSFSEVLEMTDQGLSFSLAAYPSPDHFRFFHLGNRTSGSGSEVSSGRFSSLCLQNAVTLSTVNCTITPVDVPKALLGFYRATLSNDLGSVDITFSIDKEVLRPKTSSPNVSAIPGGVFAVILIIIVVIFTIVRKRNQTNPDRETGLHGSNAGDWSTTSTRGTYAGTARARPTAEVAAFAGKEDDLFESDPGYSTPEQTVPVSNTARVSSTLPSPGVRNESESDDWPIRASSLDEAPYAEVKDVTDSRAVLPSDCASADVSSKSTPFRITADGQGCNSSDSDNVTISSQGRSDGLDEAGYSVMKRCRRGVTPKPAARVEGLYAVSLCYGAPSGSDGFPHTAPDPYPKGQGAQATKDDNSYKFLALKEGQSPAAKDAIYDHVGN